MDNTRITYKELNSMEDFLELSDAVKSIMHNFSKPSREELYELVYCREAGKALIEREENEVIRLGAESILEQINILLASIDDIDMRRIVRIVKLNSRKHKKVKKENEEKGSKEGYKWLKIADTIHNISCILIVVVALALWMDVSKTIGELTATAVLTMEPILRTLIIVGSTVAFVWVWFEMFIHESVRKFKKATELSGDTEYKWVSPNGDKLNMINFHIRKMLTDSNIPEKAKNKLKNIETDILSGNSSGLEILESYVKAETIYKDMINFGYIDRPSEEE